MDRIIIENLEVFAKHGVFPEENSLGQKFLLSMDIEVDTRGAGKSDQLELSVNYGEVSHFVTKYMQEHTYKLIETVAEKLTEQLLLEYPLIRGVSLTVKKPWAPIGLSLENVGVSIERKWHRVYLSLGSNMGDRKDYLNQGITKLCQKGDCRVLKVADFIETEPYGGVEQDAFLNTCVEIETLMAPYELLDFLHEVEASAKRERIIHWGPRTLDMDILLYDDEVLAQKDLMIPHVDMCNRDFVLRPLAQIAPYAFHPLKKKCVLDLLEELEEMA